MKNKRKINFCQDVELEDVALLSEVLLRHLLFQFQDSISLEMHDARQISIVTSIMLQSDALIRLPSLFH